jgi:tetratricopeptide (TPR) repeat protein
MRGLSMLRACAIGALLASGIGVAPRAHAQSASEIASAKQWFDEGIALEEKAQFAEALVKFRRALGVKKTPQIAFHVGLCELKTGALVEALVDLERAQELAKSDNNAQVESAAASEIATLRPRIPSIEVVVQGGKPKRILLDGNALSEVAITAPIPVNPGDHEIVAENASGKSASQKLSVNEGEKGKATLTLPSESEAVPPPEDPDTPPRPPEEDRPKAQSASVLPWVLIGGGAVAAIGGFYMWKLRGDQIKELDDICPKGRDQCPQDRESDVDDHESKGKRYTTFGIGLWAIGAAAIGTGSVLLIGGSGREKAAARVTPIGGPGFVGASLGGRF